jgi:quinol monooxygenase YgiN
MSSLMEVPDPQAAVTIVSTFTLHDPAQQEALLELLRKNADGWLRDVPGFIGAALHTSIDHTRVINYAQWKDAGSVQAMLTHPEAKKHMTDVATLATVEAVRSKVASTHRPR